MKHAWLGYIPIFALGFFAAKEWPGMAMTSAFAFFIFLMWSLDK
jgi:hypothetical protein